jgi:putative ABC transport system substrate-binding protein
MRRRSILSGGVGFAIAAAAAPRAASGQTPAPPLVGFLRSTGERDSEAVVAAFRRGLAETGLVEGRDVALAFGWADNRPERLPELAAGLVARRPAAIVGNLLAARAAKAATATIPIVFITGEDPVRAGLVSNLSRPDANLTGVAFLDAPLAAKRFGMLHDLTPRLALIAVLLDPGSPTFDTELGAVEEASRTLGRRILVVQASSDAELDPAFESMARAGALSVFVGGGPFFASRRDRLVALVARHRWPAIYGLRSFAEVGGMISYGANNADSYRRAAAYVARILRGARPGDLPVELPTVYELVVNLRTARALGFEIPTHLLTAADEVIE